MKFPHQAITVKLGETLVINITDENGKLVDTHAITPQKAPEPASNPEAGLLAMLAAIIGEEPTPGCDCPACTAMRQKH